jgi:hypothetical protein
MKNHHVKKKDNFVKDFKKNHMIKKKWCEKNLNDNTNLLFTFKI